MAFCYCLYSRTPLSFLVCIVVFSVGFRVVLLKSEGDASQYNEFKLKKFNDIWLRANTKSFSHEKLQKLKKVLVKLDRLELEIKHWDMEEQSEYKKVKPKVHEYLNEVLEEYGLLEHDLLKYDGMHFHDDRLIQLWEHAVNNGHYSKKELHSLHSEMRHIEKRLEELHMLNDKTERDPRDNKNDARSAENMTGQSHKELEEKKAMINNQLKKLQEAVLNKTKTEFNDDRVHNLWESAQNASFTAEELQTVKVELDHFQRHIDKLEHWVSVMSELQDKGSKKEILHAEDKISEYKRKVKKHDKTMRQKINEKFEL